TDPARLSRGFQARSYVDPVAEDILVLDDHVAEVDPNAELDPFFPHDSRITLGHSPLYLHAAPHGVDHARKLAEKAVASVLDGPTMVLCDFRLDQFPKVRQQPFVRPLLILAHQPRIPHISG